MLVALDTVRAVAIIASIVIAGWVLPIGFRVRNSRQIGCYSLAAYAAFSAMFEVERLGEPEVSPGLGLILVGTVFGLAYCRRVTRELRAGSRSG